MHFGCSRLCREACSPVRILCRIGRPLRRPVQMQNIVSKLNSRHKFQLEIYVHDRKHIKQSTLFEAAMQARPIGMKTMPTNRRTGITWLSKGYNQTVWISETKTFESKCELIRYGKIIGLTIWGASIGLHAGSSCWVNAWSSEWKDWS